MRRTRPRRALHWLLLPLLAACTDAPSADDPAPVVVSLVVAEGAPVARGEVGPGDRANSLAITGVNGTLVLEELNLIVDRVQLTTPGGERVDAQAGARLVDVPVDEVPVQVASRLVAPGSYSALALVVRRLETPGATGGSEPVTSGVAPGERFPAWPGEASVRVVGFFEPAGGGERRPFVTYLAGEAELELAFDSPRKVGGGDAPTGIAVEVDPRSWFTREDGSVTDLSRHHFPATGEPVELGPAFADGFTAAAPGG